MQLDHGSWVVDHYVKPLVSNPTCQKRLSPKVILSDLVCLLKSDTLSVTEF